MVHLRCETSHGHSDRLRSLGCAERLSLLHPRQRLLGLFDQIPLSPKETRLVFQRLDEHRDRPSDISPTNACFDSFDFAVETKGWGLFYFRGWIIVCLEPFSDHNPPISAWVIEKSPINI